ncbi:hypothetical protein CEQ90_17035 [Lewinellaceae bacterium SD302]|nr:hypothetical protein CEQ90_17035 [Lewinellaceae bacterium SD302]
MEKPKIFLLLLLITAGILCGQTTDELSFIKTQNLSYLLTGDSLYYQNPETFEWERWERPEPIGYIGEGYKRLRIHYTKVEKSANDSLLYEVSGKTKVADNICDFTGTIRVTQANVDASEFAPDAQLGSLSGEFVFYEDETQKGSGTFEGTFWSRYWLPHGKRTPPLAASGPERSFDNPAAIAIYNTIDLDDPGFGNNQFFGEWTSYRSGKKQPVVWADFRFSFATDLDIGASEFSPNPTYYERGWRSYTEAWLRSNDSAASQAARQIEMAEWWK